MPVDLNDKILLDFLMETGKIQQQLNEQLLDLEQSPEDADLLDSIFQGFHSIERRSSSLSVTSLADLCHKSEEIFNLLRNGDLKQDVDKMETFFQVLDEVNSMVEKVRAGIDPSPADPALIQRLSGIQSAASWGEVVEESAGNGRGEAGDANLAAGGDDRSDEEFTALLDSLPDKNSAELTEDPETVAPAATEDSSSADDEISDDEFEALLNNLPGKDKGPKEASTCASNSDEISRYVFDALVDALHDRGEGQTLETIKAGPATRSQSKEKPPADFMTVSSSAKPESQRPAPASSAAARKETRQATLKTATSGTVRLDISRLDDILNLVGELVLARNRLNTLKESFDDESVHEAISNLDMVTGDLQTAVMKTRMHPVIKVFGRFPRVVRDLSRSLKKKVHLEMEGEETELDSSLLEALADPLVHLVRHSVDHGIETPDIREQAGKPRKGTVVLAARQAGGHILLSISDDGAGMDPELMRQRVVDSGLMDAETASGLDDAGCFDLIFLPGFSLREPVPDVSGRGVGMDVLKNRITELNGTIEIESEQGRGTVLKIKLPLALAIFPTLIVQLGTRKFALPLANVSEIFGLSSKKTSIVAGKEVVLNRGKAPPLFHLRKWLLNDSERSQSRPDNPQVIIVRAANTQAGLVVDKVISQEEVVIQPLGAMLQDVPGLAGSTITGDGSIAIILDVPDLLQHYAWSFESRS